MPKVSSIFSYCARFEDISIEEVAEYNGPHPNLIPVENIFSENKLGNRVLYPQVLPQTVEDLNFDLAILRSIIKLCPDNFYKKSFHKIQIPQNLISIMPDMQKLIKVFIDALAPRDLVTLVLQSDNMGSKNLGTIIRPQLLKPEGRVLLEVNGKKYQLQTGNLTIIPVAATKIDIKFESSDALLLGRDRVIAEVSGGDVGLALDLRKVKI